MVTLAEKAGKHVELMVVPGSDPYEAVVQTAARLQSSRIVMGLSPKLTPSEQGAQVGYYWEQLPEPRPSLSLEIVLENQKDTVFFNLGPHPPRLWPEDIDLVHRLWLELSAKGPGSKLHHRDIIGVALRRMNAELHSDRSSGSGGRRPARSFQRRQRATIRSIHGPVLTEFTSVLESGTGIMPVGHWPVRRPPRWWSPPPSLFPSSRSGARRRSC